MSEYTLEQKIEYARERLATARQAVADAEALHESARELGGGIPGFGLSVVVGRSKPAKGRGRQLWALA